VSLCLAAPLLAVTLAAPAFTLAWTHSVEKTEWRERWRVAGDTLVLDEARVRGSGAGMEPPEGAVLQDGWWIYRADLRVPLLRLATSGATGSGWRLCTEADGCRELEALLSTDGRLPAWVEVRPGACSPR
jgi:hypothetical protein